MPYVDPTGKQPGYSSEPQPDLGLTQWSDDIPPDPVPQTVGAAQGGIALIKAGLMDAVQAAVDAVDTPPEVKWAFNRAATWQRRSPALAYLAQKAGITDAQMDSLFIAADVIKA
jgi:hypothetical protein